MHGSPWRSSDNDEDHTPSTYRDTRFTFQIKFEPSALDITVFQVAMAATPPSHIILSPSTYGALQREFEQATPSDDDQEPPFA